MKNLPEFKALIERYESITIEEIKAISGDDDRYFDSEYVMAVLTGFGRTVSCSLCVAVGHKNIYTYNCHKCVYGGNPDTGEFKCAQHPTYDAIEDAATPSQLLTAIRNRAAYMRTLLPEE